VTSVIYVSLSALLIVWLSLNVIKVRRKKQVSVGDGDDIELITAMAAQANTLEYLPIALLLLCLYASNSFWGAAGLIFLFISDVRELTRNIHSLTYRYSSSLR
jgi:hypothetical protein